MSQANFLEKELNVMKKIKYLIVFALSFSLGFSLTEINKPKLMISNLKFTDVKNSTFQELLRVDPKGRVFIVEQSPDYFVSMFVNSKGEATYYKTDTRQNIRASRITKLNVR